MPIKLLLEMIACAATGAALGAFLAFDGGGDGWRLWIAGAVFGIAGAWLPWAWEADRKGAVEWFARWNRSDAE